MIVPGNQTRMTKITDGEQVAGGEPMQIDRAIHSFNGDIFSGFFEISRVRVDT